MWLLWSKVVARLGCSSGFYTAGVLEPTIPTAHRRNPNYSSRDGSVFEKTLEAVGCSLSRDDSRI